MKDFILGAAVGYLLARYFIFSMERGEYLKKEAETLDNIKNKIHDLLNKVAPQLSDDEVVTEVENATETE